MSENTKRAVSYYSSIIKHYVIQSQLTHRSRKDNLIVANMPNIHWF